MPESMYTAPKDGSYVFLSLENGDVCTGRFVRAEQASNPVAHAMAGDRGYWQAYGSNTSVQPRSWWPIEEEAP